MGAYCNDGLSLSPIYSFASSQDLRLSKHVHDNVHGNIYIDPVSIFIYLFPFSLSLSLSLEKSVLCDLSFK